MGVVVTTTVTTTEFVAPGNYRSIGQDTGKSMSRGLDLLHAFQVILPSTTVATKVRAAPGNYRSICEELQKPDSRLGSAACLSADLATNSVVVTIVTTTVTTTEFVAPENYRSIGQVTGKSMSRGLDLLHAFQLILHTTTVTTKIRAAPVTTDPSVGRTAEARFEAWICCMPFS